VDIFFAQSSQLEVKLRRRTNNRYNSAMPRSEEFVPVSLEPDPVIEYYKQFIDRSLLRENLKLTPTERVRKMQRWGASTPSCARRAKLRDDRRTP
jgi:hypothetical protein